MGTVTSATLTGVDGSVEQIDGWSWGTLTGGRGRSSWATTTSVGCCPGACSGGGMWRYRRLLPVGEGEVRYPLQIGGTPLVASPRLREVTGMGRLWFKDETRTPTGSNKDRATALVLEQALRNGVGTVSCASTGNVAVSLSVGAAACGVRAVIFVPAEVSETKLRLMLLAGAAVIKVEDGYEAAFRLSREAAKAFGWYDRNTGVNPLTIEAKKTVAFEIWEQLGRRVPDAIILSVGDGPTYSAMVKGFRELVACGATEKLPRVVGVQAEGCQPLARAWRTGSPVRSVRPRTVADGIAVGAPVSAALVLRDARETGGGFVTVSDGEMLEAIGTLASGGGIVAEPAGAAAFAGLSKAVSGGLISEDEETVVHVTGTGLKNPQYLRPTTEAAIVRAGLEEVEAVLEMNSTERGLV
ncbi:threonine synthase [Rubrobacter tropicus]|uniref:Threonine synthase n=1 Tax=Rubrobacter tropicus TaxID=2653851 RepID=A0A6G8Q644_9ACTN|nr:threonine synthase [Rubrobacter tropicus]QIN81951.1 threonine synthase [Rubrobacter tropicus]